MVGGVPFPEGAAKVVWTVIVQDQNLDGIVFLLELSHVATASREGGCEKRKVGSFHSCLQKERMSPPFPTSYWPEYGSSSGDQGSPLEPWDKSFMVKMSE